MKSEDKHRFPWKWYLRDLNKIPKRGVTVFSCFSCGGGSSMGYKLAGCDVIGNCEIDPKVAAVYKKNLRPKHLYNMDIREFVKMLRSEVPAHLKGLDILDGSPPCSVFSTAGKRDKDWGKQKKFREGQKKQTLDDLFLRFIEVADVLKPKAVIAENVTGLLAGAAKGIVNEIITAFESAGYDVQIFKLAAMTMGVPQKRVRVFFIARRKDLNLPPLKLQYNEPSIMFGEVRSQEGVKIDSAHRKWLFGRMRPGDKRLSDINKRLRNKNIGFTNPILRDDKVANTLVSGGSVYRRHDKKKLSNADMVNMQTFPQDYDFLNESVQFICGMSVPPVMMANIATDVCNAWFKR